MLSSKNTVLNMQLEGSTLDYSPKSNTPTSVGTLTYVNDTFGKSCSPISSSKYFYFPSSMTDIKFTDGTNDIPFTLAMRIRPPSTLVASYLFNSYSGGSGCDLLMYLNADGSIFLWLVAGASTSNRIGVISSAGAITAGAINHIVFTYDGSKSYTGISMYINGKKVTTSSNANGTYTGMILSSRNTNFGKHLSSTTGAYTGGIDSLYILKNKALSENDIRRIYMNLHPLEI